MTEALLSLLPVCGLLLLSQLSPGPDVFFVFRSALAQGFRAGVAVGAGISAGFLVQAGVACTVGAWVMQQSWSCYMLYAAAAWLLYLAWKIFPKHRQSSELDLEQKGQVAGCRALLWQGLLCNILNPKCMLFILTLSTGALQAHAQLFWYAPLLAVALTVTGMLGWALWSALLQCSAVQVYYRRHTALIDTVFALLLACFAVLLASQS